MNPMESAKDVSDSVVLGIDIGGSGIKGAPVDLEKGVLVEDRSRIPTPRRAKPGPVAEVVAEERASDRARSQNQWSWKKWAKHLDEYLLYVEALLSPDMFVLGGGVSKKHERFLGYLTTSAPVVPAEMRNEAGIVGAALSARLEIPSDLA